jgi:precorrin-2 dehydrogenase/sirohydrochlorin ferrochelatase
VQKKNSQKSNRKATPTLSTSGGLPPRGGGGEIPASRITYHDYYYPTFLNLQSKKVVVVGGGKVAERKILALLKTGANITIISPEITKRIAREKIRGNLKHIPRQYRKGDVRKTFLVIAATDSDEINKKISEEAPCLVNVVDTPSFCNFIVPSVLKRGPLTIAVSTGGISPALSKSIRQELEKLYGPEFSEYLGLVERIREKAKKEIQDTKKRSEFLKSLASGEMMKTLREKGHREVAKRIEKSKKHRIDQEL